MAAKRKAVNGAKKCTGPCGLTLALYMYRSNGAGQLASNCHACHRLRQSAWARAKYANNPEFREREKAKRRAAYRANEAVRKRRIRMAVERKRRVRQDGESREADQARWRERYRSDAEFRAKIRARNLAYRLRMKGAA